MALRTEFRGTNEGPGREGVSLTAGGCRMSGPSGIPTWPVAGVGTSEYGDHGKSAVRTAYASKIWGT